MTWPPPGVELGRSFGGGITRMYGPHEDKAIHSPIGTVASLPPVPDQLTAAQRANVRAIFEANATSIAVAKGVLLASRPPRPGEAAFIETDFASVQQRYLADHWLAYASGMLGIDMPRIQWFADLPAADFTNAARVGWRPFAGTRTLLGCVRAKQPDTVLLHADQSFPALLETTFHEAQHVKQYRDGPAQDDDLDELDARRFAADAAPFHLAHCTDCRALMQGCL